MAGFLTEYSGLRWAMFFLGEYGNMTIVSAITTSLFLGGWAGPGVAFLTGTNMAAGWQPPGTGLLYNQGLPALLCLHLDTCDLTPFAFGSVDAICLVDLDPCDVR